MPLPFLARSLRAYVGYKTGLYRPFLVIIVPTKRCNLDCSYCTENKKETENPLSTQEWLGIFRILRSMGVATLSFSGGEPLLYPRIRILIKEASRQGFFVNLNTNGTLIDESMAAFLKKHLDTLRISCDGWGAEHDRLAGQEGTFQLVRKAILHLAKSQGKAKVGINCVITQKDQSARHLVEGFRNQVDFISFLPAFDFRCKGMPVMPSQDILRISEELREQRKSGNTASFLQGKTRECDAGRLYFQIYPGGGIAACPFTKKRYSLRKWGLEHIYSIMVKEPIHECQGCHATCTTEVSRIFRSSPLALARGYMNLKETYKI